MATAIQNESQYIDAFLKLTLRPASASDLFPMLSSLTPQQRQDFVELADSNHVVIRAFEVLNRVAGNRGNNDIQAWAVETLTKERGRISNALNWLEQVCNALEEEGCPTVVMKTLDHWPDLGNDLDLVSTGPKAKIVNVFTKRFGGKIEARSWGDRLACKWNFSIPGLPESIETHVGRLGQTGEHIGLAKRCIDRRVTVRGNGNQFWVPAPDERIFSATVPRMDVPFFFCVWCLLAA